MSTSTTDETFFLALREELITQIEADRPAAGTSRAVHRTGLRAGLVAATVAGLVAGGVLLSPGPSAFAGWSAVPTTLTGAAAQEDTERCIAAMDTYYAHTSTDLADALPGLEQPAAWSPGFTERRGRWQVTVLEGGGVLGVCNGTGHGGSSGPVRAAVLPSSETITVASLSATGVAIDPGAGGLFGGPMEGQFVVLGRVGSEVESVMLNTTIGEVTASVENGLWLAWWPLADGQLKRLDFTAESEALTATLTLRDGSVRTVDDVDGLETET